jgi:hypothetical protein
MEEVVGFLEEVSIDTGTRNTSTKVMKSSTGCATE